MTAPKITIAISTVGNRLKNVFTLLDSLIKQTDLPDKVLIICQRPHLDTHMILNEIVAHYPLLNITTIIDQGIGLSRSRNMAIMFSETQYILPADDDLVYNSYAVEKIRKYLIIFPQAAALTFQIALKQQPGQLYKSYLSKEFQHNIRSSFRVWSPEIVLNLSKIRGSAIYDPRFGLGTSWGTGEENILMVDLLKQGKELRYIPTVIALHDSCSSGDDLSESQLKSKGAMFARMFGLIGIFYSLAFVLRKISRGSLHPRRIISIISGYTAYFKAT